MSERKCCGSCAYWWHPYSKEVGDCAQHNVPTPYDAGSQCPEYCSKQEAPEDAA